MKLRYVLLIALTSLTQAVSAQDLNLKLQCTQNSLEDGNGERLIYADQARIALSGELIKEFQWESSLFRTTHGNECSIDMDDGLQAEKTEKGWRITLKDAVAARTKRGYDFDRGYQCSIRLEPEGDELHIKPTCPAMCGSRMNFSALTVNVKTGSCHYDDQ
ncbi:MAG: hypothetical protein KGM99_02320 [Burkholderiales bacterium]|nr:hypothetical protein [Burkholderiales bacterium]